ncbi:MAG: GDP-mannose 4,6-dehydratase [Lachnospiraceae bacterium]|nr:GDP-mannose 4,6-dehydratase [Lachnospiraceae bacterium]
MKVLVTGGTGMVGSHFMNSYQLEGAEVYGIARNSASSRLAAIPDQSIIRCDILERDALMRIFKQIQPDVIVHMAAQAFNGDSWNSEYVTHNTNYLGTLNVLYCAKELDYDVKVLLACSSAEYGNITVEDCPLKEDRLLTPHTPYGVSKVGVEMLGRQYFLNYGLKVYLPRMFIHVGTGHPPATAIQNFARQLALIKKGVLEPEIHVGNLESARDFIDVRDGVRAMRILLEKGNPGEPVNICVGKAYKIQEILDMLVEISGTNAKVISDKALMRVADEPLLLGDDTKIKELGFIPKYTMHDTLEDVFADWMGRI